MDERADNGIGPAGYSNADLKDGSHDTDYLRFLKDSRASWQRVFESEVGTTHQNNYETVAKHYIVDYLSDANRDILVTEDGSYTQRYVYDEDSRRISAEFGYADGAARGTTNAKGEYGENFQSDFAVQDIRKVWYRTSHLGSTLITVDEAGTVIGHTVYDPWGSPLTETYPDANFAPLDNANNFTGYTWDEVLGLYFAQNRFYDAANHRFTQEDPMRNDTNWYAYCGNDPLNYVDPNGEFGLLVGTLIATAASALVAGGLSAYQSYKMNGKVDWRQAGKAAIGGAAAAVSVGVAVATGGTSLGVGVMIAEGMAGLGAALRGGSVADTATSMGKTGAAAAVGGNVLSKLPATAKAVASVVGAIAGFNKSKQSVPNAVSTVKDPNATLQQKASAIYDAVVDVAVTAGSAAYAAKSVPAAVQEISGYAQKLQCRFAGNTESAAAGSQGKTTVTESTRQSVKAPTIPEQSKSYYDAKGRLTNGTYTIDADGMKPHLDGTSGKSRFLYGVDAEKAVLDAATYADQNNLWTASGGGFASKAKVPVIDGNVGITGSGQLTNIINVYRTKTGFIHGAPGSPIE